MKWFKHDTDANQDAKLQNVLLDHGLEGYGLYWYCIELIAGKVELDSLTFELEHDARIIARNTSSSAHRVEELMRYLINQGLFENSDGAITCLKLARRLDKSMTSNPAMRAAIGALRGEGHDPVMMPSCSSHDGVMQDKKRTEQNRTEQNNHSSSPPDGADALPPTDDEVIKPVAAVRVPYKAIINLYHEKLPEWPRVRIQTSALEKALNARWNCSQVDLGSLERWGKLFDYVRQSDFLMGRKDASQGHSSWRPDLGWLSKPSTINKLVEGNYHAG